MGQGGNKITENYKRLGMIHLWMNSHNEVLENGSEMWMLAGSIVL